LKELGLQGTILPILLLVLWIWTYIFCHTLFFTHTVKHFSLMICYHNVLSFVKSTWIMNVV